MKVEEPDGAGVDGPEAAVPVAEPGHCGQLADASVFLRAWRFKANVGGVDCGEAAIGDEPEKESEWP